MDIAAYRSPSTCGLLKPRRRRFVRSIFCAFCALLFSLSLPARAALRFDVFLGYDGILPEASWFPVVCEVFNDGPSFNAVFELSPGQYSQGQSRAMVVELPTGTLKRFSVPVFSSARSTYSWDARLLDERGKVRAETLGIRMRKQNQWRIPLIGAVTRTAGGLPVLPEIRTRQNDLQPSVARLQPALFPDNPIALEGLDAVYLNSEKALDLKVNQVNALLAWLHGGGHLIVGLEQIIHLTGNEWLRRLLPGDFTTLSTVQSHPQLQEWLRSARRYDGRDYSFSDAPVAPTSSRKPALRSSPSSSVNPYAKLADDSKFEQEPLQLAIGSVRDGAVLMGPTESPLAIVAKRGRGQITVLTFSPELEPFLSWKNRSHFWAKLVDVPPELYASEQYNRYGGQSIDGVFGAMIDSKQVRKLPVGWLLLLLVGYLAVIGPLDQYWLKKINRQMLTWLTFPAYVACFSVLIYIIGYKLRAGESEWNELHIVDVLPLGEQADLRGRTYASIYSPVNAKYKMASEEPFATLRGEFLGNYNRGGIDASRANVEQKGNSFLAEVSVPVWTSQLFVSDWWRQGATPLKVSVTPDGAQWQVQVENRLETTLTKAKLVIENSILDLGEVPRHETKTFQVARSSGTPLQSFVVQYAGNFEQAVNQRQSAFGNERAAQIQDVPNGTMAISFISQFHQTTQHGYYQRFITPPGLDLAPLVERGDAVLLAWAENYAPAKGLNRFSPRRSDRDTLLRVAVPIK
jgi:hypothetical protein